jgi:hypothetical protein
MDGRFTAAEAHAGICIRGIGGIGICEPGAGYGGGAKLCGGGGIGPPAVWQLHPFS